MAGALFALGRTNERDITSALSAGTNQIPITNADTYFATGDLVFVSEADASEVEFLGAATSVTTSQIVTTFAVAEAKATNGKAWKPQSKIAVSGTFGSPENRKLDRGLVVQRSLGGTPYAMDVGALVEHFDLKIAGLTPRELDGLLAWLDTTTGGGKIAFTIVHLDRSVEAVRLTGIPETVVRASGGRSSVQLPVLSEGHAIFA